MIIIIRRLCFLSPLDITTQWPDEHFQEKRSNFDRRVLPSAPRAATAAEIDMSRLPSKPPYTVYLGNLSYECSEEDVIQLFERKKLKVNPLVLSKSLNSILFVCSRLIQYVFHLKVGHSV